VVPTTVSQALTIAGGFREYADTKNVLVMRGPKRYKFNYKDWSRGKNLAQVEVMVSVMSVNSKKYFVMGGVTRPGQYPLVVPTTVSQALTIAGGFREYADTKNVLVMRGPKRYKFNYKDWSRGKNLSQDIYLQSGDHIVVAE